MGNMSSDHKLTTEPTAVQAAQGATGQDAVAPVPPSACICGMPVAEEYDDGEPVVCEYHRVNGGGPLNVAAPVRRHPITGFECSCSNGPCSTLDRHIDERLYLRDQKYGDPWKRPSASANLDEQRHVELLAAILHAAGAADIRLERVYSTVPDALAGARQIIRQNRESNKR